MKKRIKIVLVVFIVLLFPLVVGAESFEWKGAKSGARAEDIQKKFLNNDTLKESISTSPINARESSISVSRMSWWRSPESKRAFNEKFGRHVMSVYFSFCDNKLCTLIVGYKKPDSIAQQDSMLATLKKKFGGQTIHDTTCTSTEVPMSYNLWDDCFKIYFMDDELMDTIAIKKLPYNEQEFLKELE